jgi:hypothetical protein
MTTLRKYEPSDPNFQAYLEERGYMNQNIQELALEEYSPNNGSHQDSLTRSIVGGYDFLGVSERRDESLVVLKLLLGLPTSKILYLENPTPFVYEDERCFMVKSNPSSRLACEPISAALLGMKGLKETFCCTELRIDRLT